MTTARVILVSDTHLSADARGRRPTGTPWSATSAPPVPIWSFTSATSAPMGHTTPGLPLDGTNHLWVPTTWAVLPDQAQPVLGVKRCGIVSLALGTGTPARPEFIEPPGLEQLII